MVVQHQCGAQIALWEAFCKPSWRTLPKQVQTLPHLHGKLVSQLALKVQSKLGWACFSLAFLFSRLSRSCKPESTSDLSLLGHLRLPGRVVFPHLVGEMCPLRLQEPRRLHASTTRTPGATSALGHFSLCSSDVYGEESWSMGAVTRCTVEYCLYDGRRGTDECEHHGKK